MLYRDLIDELEEFLMEGLDNLKVVWESVKSKSPGHSTIPGYGTFGFIKSGAKFFVYIKKGGIRFPIIEYSEANSNNPYIKFMIPTEINKIYDKPKIKNILAVFVKTYNETGIGKFIEEGEEDPQHKKECEELKNKCEKEKDKESCDKVESECKTFDVKNFIKVGMKVKYGKKFVMTVGQSLTLDRKTPPAIGNYDGNIESVKDDNAEKDNNEPQQSPEENTTEPEEHNEPQQSPEENKDDLLSKEKEIIKRLKDDLFK